MTAAVRWFIAQVAERDPSELLRLAEFFAEQVKGEAL